MNFIHCPFGVLFIHLLPNLLTLCIQVWLLFVIQEPWSLSFIYLFNTLVIFFLIMSAIALNFPLEAAFVIVYTYE